MTRSVAAQIYKNDVGTDLLDVFIADDDVGVSFKKAAEMKAFGYDDLMDLPGALVKLNVHYVADFLTVSDIDDFFFLKTGK